MECMPTCKSQNHLTGVNQALRLLENDEQAVIYCQSCCNSHRNYDESGKTLIHQISSLDRPKLLEVLLPKCKASLNTRDQESGWTPLHRSLFYGRIHTAVTLIKGGAKMSTKDNEGLTPLQLIALDRSYLPFTQNHETSGSFDVYTWGDNSNYSLGHGRDTKSDFPERIESIRKNQLSVNKIIMRKYHSVVLCSNGSVYTCGLGRGGRLGSGHEQSVLKLCAVKLPTTQIFTGCGDVSFKNVVITDIASSRGHTILLDENGRVFGSGSNEFFQLGAMNAEFTKLLSFKQICAKLSKSSQIKHISTGRFHTCIAAEDKIYSFGLNAGQLGLSKNHPEKHVLPHLVNIHTSKHTEYKTQMIKCCDSATCMVITPITEGSKREGFYLLYKHDTTFISFRGGRFEKTIKNIALKGGYIDHSALPNQLQEAGGDNLVVVWLNGVGQLLIWTEDVRTIRQIIFPAFGRQLTVTGFDLSSTEILASTVEGAAYTVELTKSKISKQITRSSLTSSQEHKSARDIEPFQPLLELKSKRIQGVHRAVRCSIDPGSRNFALIQAREYTMRLNDDISVTDKLDYEELLTNSQQHDGVSDITIKSSDGYSFYCHKFILVNRSTYFRQRIESNRHSCTQLDLVGSSDEIRCLINLIYTGRTSLELPQSYPMPRKAKKKGQPVSRQPTFEEQVISKYQCKKLVNSKPRFNLCHHSTPYTDLELISEDGQGLFCDKCVLYARLEYFKMMLSVNWSEGTEKITRLDLPIPMNVLRATIEYVYTGDSTHIIAKNDVEFTMNILVVADQLLFTDLKTECENLILSQFTLNNVSQLYQLSHTYNCEVVKDAALFMICVNITELLELGALEDLEAELLSHISDGYRQKLSCAYRRAFDNSYIGTSERMENMQLTIAELIAEQNKPQSQREGTPEPTRKSRRRRTSSNTSTVSTEEAIKAQRKLELSGDSSVEKVDDSSLHFNDETFADEFDDLELSSTSLREDNSLHTKSEPLKAQVRSHETRLSQQFTPTPVVTSPTPSTKSLTDIMKEQEKMQAINQLNKPANSISKSKKKTHYKPINLNRSTSLEDQIRPAISSPSDQRDTPPHVNPWENNSKPWSTPKSATHPVSLKDIISNQERPVVNQITKTQLTPASNAAVPTYNTNQRISLKPTVSTVKTTPSDTKLLTSPQPALTSPSVLTSPSALTSQTSLSDIMRTQKTEQEHLARQTNKPLEFVQVEERAISELLEYYKRKRATPYERITVERVKSTSAVPMWAAKSSPQV